MKKSSALIDHPATMCVLHSIIDDDVEKIRCENCFLSYRYRGDGHKGWTPHAGGRPSIRTTAISITTAAYTPA